MAGEAEAGVTLRQALAAARRSLESEQIEDAALEAELLLRQALRDGNDFLPSRAMLYQRFEEVVASRATKALASLLKRRLAHEPSAYITGLREFWGLEFAVGPAVLIPRPETELLVETAVAILRRPASQGDSRRTSPIVVDAGTGSGAIAIALARELPGAVVYATDTSWEALDIARENARRHGVAGRIAFRHGDLLAPVDRYVDLIVANLPYVTTKDWGELAPEVRGHEPRLALDGGDDGLDLIHALLHQAPRYLASGGAVCLEFGIGQRDAILESVDQLLPGADTRVIDDFADIPRVLVART